MKKHIAQAIGLLGLLLFIYSGGIPFQNASPGNVSLARLDSTGKQPPKLIQVLIVPPVPNRQSIVSTEIRTEDGRHEVLKFRYRWMINQELVSEESHLALSRYKPGDLVSVEVTPFDGSLEGAAIKSAPVNVANHSPKISKVSLSMQKGFEGAAIIQAEVTGWDLDGDPIRYQYQWHINDNAVINNDTDQLDAALVGDRDKVILVVTPRDPYSEGQPKVTSMLLKNNRYPQITSTPPREIEGELYSYQVISSDPDRDVLSYHLVSGPPDMLIDSKSGLLTWPVVVIPEGKAEVALSVEDGKGGHGEQRFTIQSAQ